jgi:hypothetical protein
LSWFVVLMHKLLPRLLVLLRNRDHATLLEHDVSEDIVGRRQNSGKSTGHVFNMQSLCLIMVCTCMDRTSAAVVCMSRIMRVSYVLPATVQQCCA